MNDTPIIVIVTVLFVSGGLAVFFWWRSQYGVWARRRKGRDAGPARTTVVLDRTGAPRVTDPPARAPR